MSNLSSLFQPITLGAVTLQNRMAMALLTRMDLPLNTPDSDTFYTHDAKGYIDYPSAELNVA